MCSYDQHLLVPQYDDSKDWNEFNVVYNSCTITYLLIVDIELGQWSEQPDADGVRQRKNTFTIALHASFGPKTTASSEKQVRSLVYLVWSNSYLVM